MADTGMIRWPMNFPPSSNTAILNEASVGKTTCPGKDRNSLKMWHPDQLMSWIRTVPSVTSISVLLLTHLLEDDGLFVPDGVDGVALRCLGLEGLPLGVHRQAEHVHLHIRAHLLIGQELA